MVVAVQIGGNLNTVEASAPPKGVQTLVEVVQTLVEVLRQSQALTSRALVLRVLSLDRDVPFLYRPSPEARDWEVYRQIHPDRATASWRGKRGPRIQVGRRHA